MTLTEFQEEIAVDFDSSPTALASTDTEYSRRTKLINRFEKLWAKRMFYKWAVLYKETTLNTVADTATVDLPSGFEVGNLLLSKDNKIKIGGYWYDYVRPEERYRYSTGTRLVWITGSNPEGFQLNIQPTPTDVLDIEFRYFSNLLATDTAGTTEKLVMAEGSDQTKCPNPDYITYSVLSILYKTDDEGNKGVDYERLAEDVFQDMVALENKQNFNQNRLIESTHNLSMYPVLGE